MPNQNLQLIERLKTKGGLYTKYKKFATDKPNGKLVGTLEPIDWLGEQIGKPIKDKNSDSFFYKFQYPKESGMLIPDGMTYNTIYKPFYILAEPDEIVNKKLNTVGMGIAKGVEATGEGIKEGAKIVKKTLTKGLVGLIVVLLIAAFIYKKI